MCCLLYTGSGHRCGWGTVLVGFNLGRLIRFPALEVVEALWRFGIPLLWKLRSLWFGSGDYHVHLFVADVVKSFDTVDRVILDFVLGRLGLPGWFGSFFLPRQCRFEI